MRRSGSESTSVSRARGGSETKAGVRTTVGRSKPKSAASAKAPAKASSAKSTAGKQDKDSYSQGNDPQVVSICGPILFTAAHGLKVLRGGVGGERQRTHLREEFVSELALKLAHYVQQRHPFQGSFVVWNAKTAVKEAPSNLDPNYLLSSQFAKSPWHQALKTFRASFPGVPLLMVDVHGKVNRKTNLDIDVGMMPMEVGPCLVGGCRP